MLPEFLPGPLAHMVLVEDIPVILVPSGEIPPSVPRISAWE